jgi:hypothetical protein
MNCGLLWGLWLFKIDSHPKQIYGRNNAMEATKVPFKEIKVDPLAHELATSERTTLPRLLD